jgi:Ca-activated chloride channel homolog
MESLLANLKSDRSTPPFRRRIADRRGAMLPLIAILLPVMLIFLGFAVDLAYMQTTRLELQAAADSAARAGATRLSQTDDQDQARDVAKDIARQNPVAGSPLLLRNSDVRIGRSTMNGNGKWVFRAGASPANAVRVSAPRTTASRGGPVHLFFGSLIGTPSFQPQQIATASFLNVDICLVLDRSTSMKLGVTESDGGMGGSDSRMCSPPNSASRWRALDGAVRVFLEELEDTEAEEQVALATYNSGSESPQFFCGSSNNPSSLDVPLTTDLSRTEAAMNRLNTTVWNGYTYIESGIRTGLGALQDPGRARRSAEKVMIVLTDGHQNVGNALNAARLCTDAEIMVHTITFSDGADQVAMRQVATETGGQHFHASNATQLRKIFRDLAAQPTRLTE